MRLIDTELTITIEASSKDMFSIKVHPGRTKVRDVMEQIERKLEVPSKDQTLYFGKTRLSDTPMKGLPHKLICSPKPTLLVHVPECIQVTLVDQNGKTIVMNVDKEKGLKALMEEISLRINLQENEEAILYFKGRQLCPSKDKGTLTSLGLSTGSRLELKVEILFIEIKVWFWDGSPSISVRCSPQETFKDLMKNIGKKGKKGKAPRHEGAVFAVNERVFDPDQDQGCLQGTTSRYFLKSFRNVCALEHIWYRTIFSYRNSWS